MRIIKNKLSTAIITLMVILWVPLAASAADMWAETPDLNGDAGSSSFTAEHHALKYEPPSVDMWAESPNLDAGKKDHGVRIEGVYRFTNYFNPEMYAETPGLNDIPPGSPSDTMDSILLAKEK
jgi:hypothetical protein